MERHIRMTLTVDATSYDDEAMKPEIERAISDTMLGTCFTGKRGQRSLANNGRITVELTEFHQKTED